MKLVEFLKTVDKDEYIYLGAASGFLWIGLPDEIIEKLPWLDEDYIERNKESIKRNAWKIKDIEKQIDDTEASVRDADQRRRLLRRMNLELARAYKREKALNEYAEKRIPFGEREVRDVYRRRIVEPAGTVVLVKGREIGDYWMLEEVLNREGVRESAE